MKLLLYWWWFVVECYMHVFSVGTVHLWMLLCW